MKIFFFGHFGQINFGNEATLQAILYHVRRRLPDAEITCICTDPQAAAATYGIAAVRIGNAVVKPGAPGNPLARLAQKLVVEIPREIGAWFRPLWR